LACVRTTCPEMKWSVQHRTSESVTLNVILTGLWYLYTYAT